MDRRDERVVRYLLAVSRGGRTPSWSLTSSDLFDDNDDSNEDDGDTGDDYLEPMCSSSSDSTSDSDDDDELSFCTTLHPMTGKVTRLSLGHRVHRSRGSSSPTSSSTIQGWDLPPVVARLTSLQHLSLTGCRSLPVHAMSKSMTQLRELYMIDCPVMIDDFRAADIVSKEEEGLIRHFPSIDLPGLATFSAQYNVGWNDRHDMNMDGFGGRLARRRSPSTEQNHVSSYVLPSLEWILEWIKVHCTGLKHLAISLKGPTKRTWEEDSGCIGSDIPDMILQHLSPHNRVHRHADMTSTDSIDIETAQRCFNFFSNLESITLSGCGLTELHLETLLFDNLQILEPTSNSKIKRLSVDKNNIQSLQFITQRVQERRDQDRNQRWCFSSFMISDEDMNGDGKTDRSTTSSERIRPPILSSKLEYLNLSDNPILQRMKLYPMIPSGEVEADGYDIEQESKEANAIYNLLYMMPHLHYVGYPSHVDPILKRHQSIDYIMRLNRGGRWLVEHHGLHHKYHRYACHDSDRCSLDLQQEQYQQRQQLREYGEDRLELGIQIEDSSESVQSISLWPRILQRSYDQTSKMHGLGGGFSSVRPIIQKDACAVFFLLREGPVLRNTRRPHGDFMLNDER